MTPTAALKHIPAIQYPPPIRDLFPFDMTSIYHPDPWGGAVPNLTAAQLADGLRKMLKEDERAKD